MSKPIRPEEVSNLKLASIPPEVFAAFNSLIVKGMHGTSAIVRQKDVVAAIVANLKESDRPERALEIYANHWLDVEGAYRQAGWDVEYDKPGYNENYEPTFKFSRHTGKAGR